MRRRSSAWPAAVLVVFAACDGAQRGQPDAAGPADHPTAPGADGGQQDVGVDAPDAAPSDVPRDDGGLPNADASEPQDARADHFAPARAALTRLLVAAPATLVGNGDSSCSNGVPEKGDRWCAFMRPGAPTKTELWVFNFTKATAGAAPKCDGSSPDCLRLTADLWTRSTLYNPSHPTAHRFDGDTLIFHAAAPPSTREIYEGPVWAWRPAWPEPRRLTTDAGVTCIGERRHTSVYCLDTATVQKAGDFGTVYLREFDILAGVVGDAPPSTPLPKVERISGWRMAPGALPWRAAFSPKGDRFVYSHVPTAAVRPIASVIETAKLGSATATLFLEDATDWEIAHDAMKVYFRKGVALDGRRDTGTLAIVDFPTGANPADLQPNVIDYALLGAHDDVFTDLDHGAVFVDLRDEEDPIFKIMRDRSKPTEILSLPSKVGGVQVATDLRHTLYFHGENEGEWPLIKIARNDGSGGCTLNVRREAETYGGHFTDSGHLIFWIEFPGGSEEGWYARPDTCGDRKKFGDYVGWYKLVGDDYVVFQGTDDEDSAHHLQYTQLEGGIGKGPFTPMRIDYDVEGMVAVLGRGRGIHVLYSLLREDAPQRGLLVHGPLPVE